MSSQSEETVPRLDTNTRLAYDRTRLSCERTLLAWVRTATTLIAFGFTVFSFFRFQLKDVDQSGSLISPRGFGLFMITCGLVSLLAGTTQNIFDIRRIRAQWPDAPNSIAAWLAGAMGILGLIVLLTTLARR
jgi:putative membrane protein